MNQHDGLKIQERKEKGETCTCRSRKYGQNICHDGGKEKEIRRDRCMNVHPNNWKS